MSLSLKEHRVSTSPQGDSDGFDTSESTGKDILEFDIEDEVLALKTRLVNNVSLLPLFPGLALTPNRQTTSSAGLLSTRSFSFSTDLAMPWTRC
jgi:hypothetical protein